MNTNTILLILGALFVFEFLGGLKSATASPTTSTAGTAPGIVPVGVLPLAANGYYQGPQYFDIHVGMNVTPYYFPNGTIAYLADGAGIEYDFATGQPLTNPMPPMVAGGTLL